MAGAVMVGAVRFGEAVALSLVACVGWSPGVAAALAAVGLGSGESRKSSASVFAWLVGCTVAAAAENNMGVLVAGTGCVAGVLAAGARGALRAAGGAAAAAEGAPSSGSCGAG